MFVAVDVVPNACEASTAITSNNESFTAIELFAAVSTHPTGSDPSATPSNPSTKSGSAASTVGVERGSTTRVDISNVATTIRVIPVIRLLDNSLRLMTTRPRLLLTDAEKRSMSTLRT